MAKGTKKKAAKRSAKRFGLRGKKCPKPGILVQTKGGFIGSTTGTCEKRRVLVSVEGMGTAPYKRAELKKAGKRVKEAHSAERGRFTAKTPTRSMRTPTHHTPSSSFDYRNPSRSYPSNYDASPSASSYLNPYAY